MIKFEVKYYGQREGEPRKYSHSYDEGWEPTEYFCPCCGQKPVWHDTSGGDYYVGENFMCVSCGASFNLPNGAEARQNDEQDSQRLSELRKVASPAARPEVALMVPAGNVLDASDAAWNEAIEAAREAVMGVHADAHEAAKAKDATDYTAGYQDAAIDCDEELKDLLRLHPPQRGETS